MIAHLKQKFSKLLNCCIKKTRKRLGSSDSVGLSDSNINYMGKTGIVWERRLTSNVGRMVFSRSSHEIGMSVDRSFGTGCDLLGVSRISRRGNDCHFAGRVGCHQARKGFVYGKDCLGASNVGGRGEDGNRP